jgi:hypothetical protein
MCVSINKQPIIFKNCFGFYLGFGREGVKKQFLVPNASAGNMRLYRWEYVACKLGVEGRDIHSEILFSPSQ